MPRSNSDMERRAASRPSHPGRMTRTIRAVSNAAPPRVLRIGLMMAGRIVEERIVRGRANVSIGTGEESTFVLQEALPPEFKLFERVGAHYRLNLLDSMRGRLAMGEEVLDLGAPGAGGGAARVPVHRLRLTEDARGKVVIGATTFLFQFIVPPPVQARPRLPMAVREGWLAQFDARLAVIAALSFLVHFGLVGAFYSDWMDSVVQEDIRAGFIDTLVRDPVPPPVETAQPSADATSSDPPSPTNELTPAPPKTKVGTTSRPAARDVSALVAQARRLEIDVIGALGAGANAETVLRRESGATLDLNSLGEKADGVTNRTDPLGLGDTGPIAPPMNWMPESQLPPAPSTAGPPRKVILPPLLVRDGPLTPSADVSNAEATIRKQIEPGARRCYERGLQFDPAQAGRFFVAIQIAPSGEVDSAIATQNTGLSAPVAKCILDVVKRARFERPAGGSGALLGVPFSFLKQR